MTLSDIDLISLQNIKNLSIQTSQKISKQNINNFISSYLQVNDIKIKEHDKIFYVYINEANIYEIYILNSNKNNIQTQAHIFKSNKNTYDLFICLNYFIIYKNSKFYFYKENKNYNINDIKNFIHYKYKFSVNNIYNIDKSKYKTYEKRFLELNKHNKLSFIILKKNYSFYYYCFYLIILASVLFYYININTKESKQKFVNKTIVYKNNYKINNIIKTINSYNIHIQELKYQNSYLLTLSSKNKNNIFKFLNKYKQNIYIYSLYKNNKTYIIEIKIDA